MNRQECQKLIDSYVDWLRQGLAVEEVGGACHLTTPLLDRLATTSDQFASLDDSPRNQMVACPRPQVRYNDASTPLSVLTMRTCLKEEPPCTSSSCSW